MSISRLVGSLFLNEKGIDTGYVVPAVLDDGRVVGIGHLIPLTYQDPLDGAVEIDGKKYVYEQKIAVTDAFVPIDPADNSAPSEQYAGMTSCCRQRRRSDPA